MNYRAYLDIETTGLSPEESELTVIGIYKENGRDSRVMQLVGEDISSDSLMSAIGNISTLYTYNGSRFDLPFIKAKLNVDLTECCLHEDLMYACWKRNLKGGLKSVERQLGIARELTGIDGWAAVQLWWDYVNGGSLDALATLLKYNEEDVLNLRTLKEMLKV